MNRCRVDSQLRQSERPDAQHHHQREFQLGGGLRPTGRITSFNATGDAVGFTYDNNGNRLTSIRNRNSQTTTRNYTVPATVNRPSGFTQTTGTTTTSVAYTYNANGDMTSDGLRTFTYDAEGRLGAATTGASDSSPTTRYAHNALGQRVFKTEPLYPPAQGDEGNAGFMASLVAFFTQFWGPAASDAEKLGFAYMYDEDGTLLSETGTGGANSTGSTQYIYLPTASGPMPIAVVVNGVKYAVHADHLNTPRRLTDATGQAVWQWAYSAFGEEKPTQARNRFADLDVTPNPGTTNISAVEFNLRYPGQYFDKESGLHYNGFRTYSAEPGRYTQPDPIGLDGGWNRFAYVDNNPLRFADPLGLWSVDVGIFLGSGVNFSFGRDEGSGRLFFSTQLGKGVGGSVMYAPHGGLPSGMDKLLDCGNEQVFAGAFGKVGVSALGASLDIASADVGVSLPSTRPYTGQSWLDYSLGKKWGLKAEVSGGVQFTTISAARFPASCGCR